MTTTTIATGEPTITVAAWNHGGWQRWTVTGTADQIIAYRERRNAGLDVLDNGAVQLDELFLDDEWTGQRDAIRPAFPFGPWSQGQERLYDYLYPRCEHGMDLQSCYGPEHFMDRAQEMALGYY